MGESEVIMDKETINIFLKTNKPINFFQLERAAIFIWSEKRTQKTDYNFDYALSYDSIKLLGRRKEHIFFEIENDNRIYLKLKKSENNIPVMDFDIQEIRKEIKDGKFV